MIKDIVGINRQFYDWTRQGPWKTTNDYVDFNVTREENTLYIKFQESQNIDTKNGRYDWLRNLNFLPKYDPFLKVFCCRGFLEGLANCAPSILKELYINGSLSCVEKIVISGNSQGSDIALIFAYYLSNILLDTNVKIEVYAFTPSRIWWCLFSWRLRKYLKSSNVHLVIAYGDPISKLPASWWGYKHIGTKHMVGNPKANLDINKHQPEVFRMFLQEVKVK